MSSVFSRLRKKKGGAPKEASKEQRQPAAKKEPRWRQLQREQLERRRAVGGGMSEDAAGFGGWLVREHQHQQYIKAVILAQACLRKWKGRRTLEQRKKACFRGCLSAAV